MRLAIASTSPLSIPLIEALQKSEHEIAYVLTFPDSPRGRGQINQESALAIALASQDFSIHKISTDQELHLLLKEEIVDLVITLSFGKLIKEQELTIPRFGWLNVHFSLLPAYRGASPVQRAILDGAEEFGVTIFKLEAGMDSGPIYKQQNFHLGNNLSAGEVLDLLALRAPSLVFESLLMIEGGIEPVDQSSEGISSAPKIFNQEAELTWGDGAERNLRKIRAFNPRPGAWTSFRGQRLVIHQARHLPTVLAPGLLQSIDGLPAVGTGDGALQLLSLTPSGKRRMNGDEWIRGASHLLGNFLGDQLGSEIG